MKPQLHTVEYQLNCFTMEQPVYCSASCSSLIIVDKTNHVYKFNHKQRPQHGSDNDKEDSLHIDDYMLENQNMGHLLEEMTAGLKDVNLGLKMDVSVRVKKCLTWDFGDKGLQVLVLLGYQGEFKVWAKGHNQAHYALIQSEVAEKIGKIVDFSFDQSGTIIVLGFNEGQSFYIYYLCPGLESHPMTISLKSQIRIKTQLDNHVIKDVQSAKLVDKNQIILFSSMLIGIYDDFTLELPRQNPKSLVKTIDFGLKFLVYGEQRNLWIHEQKSSKFQCALKEKDIVKVKLNQTNGYFVCVSVNPTQLLIVSFSEQLLWTIELSQIQNPVVLEQTQATQFYIQILDRETLKVHSLTNQCLRNSLPPMPALQEEQKVHESTLATLKHRLQIIKTLQAYSANLDFNSIFRYLRNCNNNTILNDGLAFVSNRNSVISCTASHQKQVIELANTLLQESKYESHIENALQILLKSCKRLRNSEKQQAKPWQQCLKALKQVIGSKKIKKLQQQQKNKKIFQLCYQLVHTANAQLMYHQF